MKVDLKIPKMGESIVEVTIGSILIPSGSQVKEGDEILEIETDKASQVLSAPSSGKLELSVKQGDTAKIEQMIGSIDSEGQGTAVQKEEKAAPKKEEAPPPDPKKSGSSRKKVDASLQEMSAPSAPQKEAVEETPSSQNPHETRKKMSNLRKVISQRLVQVKNETAMLTTFNEVDLQAIMKIREENQDSFLKKYGVKLGYMSFFIKATVAALQEFQDLNARIEKDEIVYPHFYHIGVAVGTDKGLFVPVIKNADQLSFADIEKQIKVFAEKAKTGSILPEEMQGGTFTITNGGTYGSMLSTPILNPPQSGILGMHNIVKRAVVIKDQIVIRPMMYLALSYDHRIVDGKGAISFLMHIKKTLEEPARFLLEL